MSTVTSPHNSATATTTQPIQQGGGTEPGEVALPTRWEVELEFVQSLSNPQYLNFLAQTKYLESQEFLNYLNYLEYWRKPENAKYLIYPNCLHILTLLKEKRFRDEISRADVAKLFMDDFYMRWLHAASDPVVPTITTSEASAEHVGNVKQENQIDTATDEKSELQGSVPIKTEN